MLFRFVLFFLACAAPVCAGELFQKTHELRTIETEHFTFVFAADQQPAAEYLASFAEDLYSDIARKLRVRKTLHLPVVLTPDTDILNGEYRSFPSMRILCYQAPLSPNSGFAHFQDNLKKLFLHELLHAVSLTQTDAFWTFWVALFGDAAYPGMYWAASSLTEGSAVAFESADGWGRANDPATAAFIQQAIIEDRFPSFLEAAGTRRYPQGIYYHYGGWFARYLIEVKGEEAFARLWQDVGRGNGLADYPLITGAFRRVYGQSLDEVWQAFRGWMALKVAVITDVRPVSDELTSVLAVTGSTQRLYWADTRGLWTLEGGRPRFLEALNTYTNRLSLSADGSRLLISTAVASGPLARARLREYDLVRRRFTDRQLPEHWTEAAYLPDGSLVGCRIAGYTTDLVTLKDGVTTVWVHGTQSSCPSVPRLMDDGRLLFLWQRDGAQSPAFLDFSDGSVAVAETGLQGIRNLATDGRRVWFAWDNDLTLLKLGVLEGDSVASYPSLSGGVQFPQGVGADLYYFGSWARGQRLMTLPRLEPAVRAVRWARIERDQALAPGVYDREPAIDSRPYNPLGWVLFPQTRFPTLFLDSASPSLVRGAGFGTESADPAQILGLSTRASWLWNDRFADVSVDGVYHGPFDISLGFFHQLLADTDPAADDLTEWGARGGLSGLVDFDLGYADWAARAAWRRTSRGDALPVSLEAGFHDLRPTDFSNEKFGFELTQAWDGVALTGGVPGVAQTDVGLRLPWGGFHAGATALAATGAAVLSTSGPLLDGEAWLGAQRFSFPAGEELTGRWAVQGQVDLGHAFPVGLEIPYGLYADSLEFQFGYRGVVFAGEYLDAAFFIAAVNFHPGVLPILARTRQSVGLKVERPVASTAQPRLLLYYGESLY